jgi:hypothetical protein
MAAFQPGNPFGGPASSEAFAPGDPFAVSGTAAATPGNPFAGFVSEPPTASVPPPPPSHDSVVSASSSATPARPRRGSAEERALALLQATLSRGSQGFVGKVGKMGGMFGWVHKRRVERWFVIDGPWLRYYESESEARAGARCMWAPPPKGKYSLIGTSMRWCEPQDGEVVLELLLSKGPERLFFPDMRAAREFEHAVAGVLEVLRFTHGGGNRPYAEAASLLPHGSGTSPQSVLAVVDRPGRAHAAASRPSP